MAGVGRILGTAPLLLTRQRYISHSGAQAGAGTRRSAQARTVPLSRSLQCLCRPDAPDPMIFKDRPRLNTLSIVAGLMLFVGHVTVALAYKHADLERLLRTGVCYQCDLRGVDLRGRDLSNSRLGRSDLSGADLRQANLRSANLGCATLDNAHLEGANLEGAVLREARLYGVDISSVRLAGADLRDADLSHLDVDMDLEWVDLTGVLLEGARFKDGVRCAGFAKKGGWGCAAR